MVEKMPITNFSQFTLSEQLLDRREDVYALIEFGKITNRYVITDQIYSDDFWNLLKENFNIKKENTTVSCDIHTDVKNRIEKMYKYVIKVDNPHKLIFHFYDEEKVIDSKMYETEEDQKNKISECMIYFDSDALEYVDEFANKIRKIVHTPKLNKTFFVISSSSMGYDLQPATIKDFDIQLELNYGESFIEKYADIVDKLKNNKHGLFLFHGDPGCGKCVDDGTMVTVRNKITGEIENISIGDFEKLL